ncbi:DUF2303 family protein [Asticcacaulis sp.]|uniref:DUF2303 family protein n=1 Tax=Asticcacaulis sp. TaxID=1872648 RepID=UPI003F7C2D78
MSEITEDGIDTIAALGRDAAKSRIHTLPNGTTLILGERGNGFELADDPTKDDHGLLLNKPTRIAVSVTIQDADSLVDYVKRFRMPGTLLFADIARNRIVAVLDYHEKPETPDHADHMAILDLPFSEEWTLWNGISGKWQEQLEFGRFLKENACDVSAPDPATLLEVAMDIQAVRNVNFTKAVRLNSDNESFEYVDDTQAKGSKGALTIPEEFALRIPVYFNGATVDVRSCLRWKLEGQSLKLGIALQRAERVRQAVFKEIAADIADRADVQVVYGTR